MKRVKLAWDCSQKISRCAGNNLGFVTYLHLSLKRDQIQRTIKIGGKGCMLLEDEILLLLFSC